jgi:hypothetical protein
MILLEAAMISVLVTGSRDWPSKTLVGCVLDDFLLSVVGQRDSVTLINGGAAGVDQMAQKYWRDNNVGNVITIYPDWHLHGKRAGIVRNVDMINMDPDYVLAFIYNTSKGSTFTLNESLRRGLKTYAFRLDSSIIKE